MSKITIPFLNNFSILLSNKPSPTNLPNYLFCKHTCLNSCALKTHCLLVTSDMEVSGACYEGFQYKDLLIPQFTYLMLKSIYPKKLCKNISYALIPD
jgi:hypothetical protein